MRNAVLLLLVVALSACAPAGPPTQPNDREWALLTADYQWIQTLRGSHRRPGPDAPRKEQIEALLENQKKLEPTYVVFIDKVREYLDRTSDPRAARLLANEKILLGDEYMNVLSRYDRAIELYREALALEPGYGAAEERIAIAEQRRYVVMNAFSRIRSGMTEEAVRGAIGLPREDWIKHVVQNSRVYSVWIYPKSDGGAAAVYFDNGRVYHTNWNAAAPPSR